MRAATAQVLTPVRSHKSMTRGNIPEIDDSGTDVAMVPEVHGHAEKIKGARKFQAHKQIQQLVSDTAACHDLTRHSLTRRTLTPLRITCTKQLSKAPILLCFSPSPTCPERPSSAISQILSHLS